MNESRSIVRVNLLPAAYASRCQYQVHLRWWIATGVIVLGLQVAGSLAVRQMGSRARELQRGLTDAEQQWVTLGQRLDELSVREDDLRRQLQLAEQLNRKHRWSELLAAVSVSLPDTIVLTRCESDPPKSSPAREQLVQSVRAGDKAVQGEATEVAGGLILGGVATDHDAVAVFLRNLNAGGHVGRCSLDSTVRQPFLKGEGVFFTIRTRW